MEDFGYLGFLSPSLEDFGGFWPQADKLGLGVRVKLTMEVKIVGLITEFLAAQKLPTFNVFFLGGGQRNAVEAWSKGYCCIVTNS